LVNYQGKQFTKDCQILVVLMNWVKLDSGPKKCNEHSRFCWRGRWHDM